jgi:hypothetical protein
VSDIITKHLAEEQIPAALREFEVEVKEDERTGDATSRMLGEKVVISPDADPKAPTTGQSRRRPRAKAA